MFLGLLGILVKKKGGGLYLTDAVNNEETQAEDVVLGFSAFSQ